MHYGFYHSFFTDSSADYILKVNGPVIQFIGPIILSAINREVKGVCVWVPILKWSTPPPAGGGEEGESILKMILFTVDIFN